MCFMYRMTNFFFSGLRVSFFLVLSFNILLLVKKTVWYIKMRAFIWLLCISTPQSDVSVSGGAVLSVTSSLLSWLLFQSF